MCQSAISLSSSARWSLSPVRSAVALAARGGESEEASEARGSGDLLRLGASRTLNPTGVYRSRWLLCSGGWACPATPCRLLGRLWQICRSQPYMYVIYCIILLYVLYVYIYIYIRVHQDMHCQRHPPSFSPGPPLSLDPSACS